MAITNTKISDLVPSEKRLANTVNMILYQDTTLVTSGIAARGPEVDAVASGGARKTSIPYLSPLVSTEVNVSSDDITVLGAVGKLTGQEFSVVRHDLNYGWGVADLTRMVTQYDALGGISAGIGQYWKEVAMARAVSSIKGALAAAPSLTTGSATVDFGSDALIDARATAGIYFDQFDTLIVSPRTRAKLDKLQPGAAVPNYLTNLGYTTWMGYKVIVSTAFGDNKTVLLRSGALAFGISDTQEKPIELQRVSNGGNGGGADILHSRRSIVCHPQGFNYVSTNVAPVLTDLEAAATWQKAIGLDDTMIGFRLINHKAS